jgi:hypothetical protein
MSTSQRSRLSRPFAIVAVGVALGLPSVCSAETIYTSLAGQDGTTITVHYDGPGGFIDSGLGSQFTVGPQDYSFDRLGISAWRWDAALDDATMTLALRADDQGKPGATLEAFTITAADIVGNGVTLARSSVLHPVLSAGASYWITAVPGMNFSMGWGLNTQGMLATFGHAPGSQGFEMWDTFASHAALAMVVEATPLPPTTVPEPSTFALLGTGVVALVRRRRRQS